ncbi:MAG: type II secretion system protein [Candidatus Gracilibacteria bacterium]
MKIVSKKAFTLIELLVVITIIGILATGAVSVYTSQIQKGRDATRISSLEALRGSVEQYYQDVSEYPLADASFGPVAGSGILQYMNALPKDPKTTQKTNYTFLDYSYAVHDDGNGLINQEYEISSGLENGGNVTAKAAKDDGNNDKRLEIGIDLKTIDSGSGTTYTTTSTPNTCGTNCIIIK